MNTVSEHLSIKERLGRLEGELLKNEAEVRMQMAKISQVEGRQMRLKGDIVRLNGAENSRKGTFRVTGTWPP